MVYYKLNQAARRAIMKKLSIVSKKAVYSVMLAAAFILLASGCGKKTAVEVEPTSTSEGSQAEESSEETKADEKEHQKEDSDSSYVFITTERSYESEWEVDGESQPIVMQAEYDRLELIDDNYPELKDSLEKINTRNANVVSEYKEANLDEAKEYLNESKKASDTANYDSQTTPYAIIGTTQIMKSDLSVVSILTDFYYNANGAHGTTSYTSDAIDPKTGNSLLLSDICVEHDKLFEYVISEINKKANADELFEDYEDIVRNEFYKDPNADDADQIGDLTWYLDNDGLHIIFGQYEIAPYAYGEMQIDISYETLKAEEFLKEEYIKFTDNPGYRLTEYMPKEINIKATGKKKTVTLSTYRNDNYGTSGDYQMSVLDINVDLDGESLDDKEEEATYQEAYAMVINDKAYLYVQLMGLDDYSFIKIYDISNDAPKYVDTIEGSFRGVAIENTEHFPLINNIDVLCSSAAYSWNKVEDGGLLKQLEDTYYLLNDDNNKSLKLIKDMKVKLVDEDNKEDELKAGEVLYPRYTNNKDYIVCETADGKMACIEYTMEETQDGEYIMPKRMIDGIPEEEYFEYLPYAG